MTFSRGRCIAAEVVGTFALVFAGTSAIVVDESRASLGPTLVGADLQHLWIYLTAPLLGAVLAAATARYLRG